MKYKDLEKNCGFKLIDTKTYKKFLNTPICEDEDILAITESSLKRFALLGLNLVDKKLEDTIIIPKFSEVTRIKHDNGGVTCSVTVKYFSIVDNWG